MAEIQGDEWRLITSSPASGALNMAIDEAILEAVSTGESQPVLRLYGWEPACLSLGYSQSLEDVDLERLSRSGWQIVRRPTGGGAILHVDELTYAVAAPADHPLLAGGILESYRRLSRGLLAGLSRLGLNVEIEPSDSRSSEEHRNPVCFEAPSAYEIVLNGMKLVGSAQVRRRSGVLQHGSIPLKGDIGRICQVLRFELEEERAQAAARVRRRASTVESSLGAPVSWEAAAEALAMGFCEALQVELKPVEISRQELQRARQLCSERYASHPWTARA